VNDLDWTYFVFGLIAYQIFRLMALAIQHEIVERRQRKFLKLVNITFPDRRDITFIALDTSDKRSMALMMRELQEKYGLSEEQTKGLVGADEDRRRDRGRDGGVRERTSWRRQDSPR
jgi:hypothetical protein